ncbi:MAG: hypothetical protein FJ137_05495 [Deltaproteobacteria bacterium]|nr:hypothetical protein [Planctomycetota bacterium]MBM4280216.1 hypothetical protein [Deltaproteobacteria bacterium]
MSNPARESGPPVPTAASSSSPSLAGIGRWHAETVAAVFATVQSSESGPSADEAVARLARQGRNVLSVRRQASPWLTLVAPLVEPLVLVLIDRRGGAVAGDRRPRRRAGGRRRRRLGRRDRVRAGAPRRAGHRRPRSDHRHRGHDLLRFCDQFMTRERRSAVLVVAAS